MSKQPGSGTVESLSNGNVVLNIELTLGSARIELTPEQVDELALRLLRKAHPKEHCFIIPVLKD